MIRVADYIADFIYRQGVRDVFMLSGGGSIYLDDGIACHGKLNHICARNEAAAPMMAEAYARVMAAFRLPKETASGKETRSRAIQEALKGAALVPMEVGRDALKIMDLAGKAAEKGNPNAVTDGAVAAVIGREKSVQGRDRRAGPAAARA